MFNTLDIAFFLRLLINLLAVLALVIVSYGNLFKHSQSSDRDHAASFILFGMGVFVVTSLLHSVDLSMGFAFGLFAVFSMLRYRTESISVREMTYLFLVIGISLLSAVGQLSLIELGCLHAVIVFIALLCELMILNTEAGEKIVHYEKIENIRPERREALMLDLKERTGLMIYDVELLDIDFLRDTAHLKIFYTVRGAEVNDSKPSEFEKTPIAHANQFHDADKTLQFKMK